jgi:hypothetical protein
MFRVGLVEENNSLGPQARRIIMANAVAKIGMDNRVKPGQQTRDDVLAALHARGIAAYAANPVFDPITGELIQTEVTMPPDAAEQATQVINANAGVAIASTILDPLRLPNGITAFNCSADVDDANGWQHTKVYPEETNQQFSIYLQSGGEMGSGAPDLGTLSRNWVTRAFRLAGAGAFPNNGAYARLAVKLAADPMIADVAAPFPWDGVFTDLANWPVDRFELVIPANTISFVHPAGTTVIKDPITFYFPARSELVQRQGHIYDPVNGPEYTRCYYIDYTGHLYLGHIFCPSFNYQQVGSYPQDPSQAAQWLTYAQAFAAKLL